MDGKTRYAFEVEWADAMAGQMRKYTLLFFPEDGNPEVEMIDNKMKRIFLKKTPVSDLALADLHIGNLVNVFSRQLSVKGYADTFTAAALSNNQEHTLMVIKPDAVPQAGSILEAINSAGLTVANLRQVQLLRKDVEEFYAEHRGKSFFENLVGFMSSGPVVALDVVGAGAIGAVRAMNGPTDSARARSEAPNSLRARFGRDGTANAVHGSDSVASAARELSFYFKVERGNPTATMSTNSTLCVVKPHATADVGKIWQTVVDAGYQVTAAQSFALDRTAATEFLEVYKGVVPEYVSMVAELTSGRLLALELSGNGGQASFRKFAGPMDPEIARHLHPTSLRAKFGADKVKNAVHCTDLPDDGPLELEYFFSILASSSHH